MFDYEVIIVGGGPSGMSAALVLGRARKSVLVINAEQPRNGVTQHSHGFLTRDGAHPFEILSEAKEQLQKYHNVTYLQDLVVDLDQQDDDSFIVRTEDEKSFSAKRVIIATGYKDNLSELNINGIEEVYGKSVFPCPFCDGWELQNLPLAIFSSGEHLGHYVQLIANWSNDIIVFTNGEGTLSEDLQREFQVNNIRVEEGKIKALHSSEGKLEAIELENGDHIIRSAGFISNTAPTESMTFLTNLNAERESLPPFGMMGYKTEFGETTVKGLYVIGDARTGWGSIANAVYEGSDVASKMIFSMVRENWIQPAIQDLSYSDLCHFETERLKVGEWHAFLNNNTWQNQTLSSIVSEILTEDVTKTLPSNWRGSYEEKRSEEWIKSRDLEGPTLLAVDKINHQAIGLIILFESANSLENIELQVGYLVAVSSWGQGFASEMLQGFIDWCQEQNAISCLRAGVSNSNSQSIRVLEKTGFFLSDSKSEEESEQFFELRLQHDSLENSTSNNLND
ncbi:MAG: GNAT family N-acetyltransferase [Gammaproteobacteria bacterium]